MKEEPLQIRWRFFFPSPYSDKGGENMEEHLIFLTDTELEGCDIKDCMLVHNSKRYKVVYATSKGLYVAEVKPNEQ